MDITKRYKRNREVNVLSRKRGLRLLHFYTNKAKQWFLRDITMINFSSFNSSVFYQSNQNHDKIDYEFQFHKILLTN